MTFYAQNLYLYLQEIIFTVVQTQIYLQVNDLMDLLTKESKYICMNVLHPTLFQKQNIKTMIHSMK